MKTIHHVVLGFTIDGNKTTLAVTTAADSSNCNIESLHNPLNHDGYTSSPVLSTNADMKYEGGSRNVIKQHLDKSIDFSPLSSPDSPEDNNEGQLSLMSTAVVGGKCDSEHSADEEDYGDAERAALTAVDRGHDDNDRRCYKGVYDDGGDDRRVRGKTEVVGLDCGRSSGRKSSQQPQQLQQEQNEVLKQSPQQHRRQVRRHRRNNSNHNNRRNRDSNFICQLTTFSATSSASVSPLTATAVGKVVGAFTDGKALEIQVCSI